VVDLRGRTAARPPHRHYLTAPFTARSIVDGNGDAVPGGVAHAKAWGGQETACGLNCGSWHKFFELDFFKWQGETCPECRHAISVARARYSDHEFSPPH
jgi:hypothetical protein